MKKMINGVFNRHGGLLCGALPTSTAVFFFSQLESRGMVSYGVRLHI